MEESDEALVKGCISGNRASQKYLYRRFASIMLGVCLRYTKSREEAEDVLQDGFMKVYAGMHQFKGSGSLEGWVRRIMVNTALENYRKTVRMYPVIHIDQVVENRADTNNASERLHAKELLQLIQELPPGYRAVFNLYAIDGYSHKEIADQLGISEGTSKSQLARARAMLQQKLKNTMRERQIGQG